MNQKSLKSGKNNFTWSIGFNKNIIFLKSREKLKKENVQKDNLWIEWYSNGSIKSEEIYDMGKPTGEWRRCDWDVNYTAIAVERGTIESGGYDNIEWTNKDLSEYRCK